MPKVSDYVGAIALNLSRSPRFRGRLSNCMGEVCTSTTLCLQEPVVARRMPWH